MKFIKILTFILTISILQVTKTAEIIEKIEWPIYLEIDDRDIEPLIIQDKDTITITDIKKLIHEKLKISEFKLTWREDISEFHENERLYTNSIDYRSFVSLGKPGQYLPDNAIVTKNMAKAYVQTFVIIK